MGKTSFTVALANSGTNHVKVVSNAESLVAKRFNADKKIAGTSQMTLESLLINVSLPSGERQIQVLWIDTPGEAFSNRDWKVNHIHA
ncbi:MAG: hypothetical protein HC773_03520 [Scytonema sp. CRU_2_7]|nr:hypothetical protein [Scytonema sp. CRU_2_7]